MAVDLEIIKRLVDDGIGSGAKTEIIYYGDLPIEWRIEFEERAAMLEYDGGLSREDADRQALIEIKKRIKNLKN